MENQFDTRLNQLKTLAPQEGGVLSVYLATDGRRLSSGYELLPQLHSLVHSHLDPRQRKGVGRYISQIENYLRFHFENVGEKSVALFAGRNLFEVLSFEFQLAPICTIRPTPYLKPIEKAIKAHPRYLVLVADHEKAFAFTVYLGKVEEGIQIHNGLVPQRVKAKKTDYGRDDKIFRHIEDHLHRHLKLITEKVGHFAAGKDIAFMIIGGHLELLNKIKNHLPYPLNLKVKGEFVTELNIPLNDIFIHSKKVTTQMNEKESVSHGY